MVVMGTLYEGLTTFMILSCCILCIMRNVAYKICRDQNTHFMFNKFFSKIMLFMRYMENIIARQATDDNIIGIVCFACQLDKARIQTHIESI
jgi:hypothetical protein